MNEDDLKVNHVRQSLLQPILFMGGERELVLMTLMVGVVMLIFIQTLLAAAFGLALIVLVPPLLRKMAKSDPDMSKVYRASLNYQKYYPAASTPFCLKPQKTTSAKTKR